MTAIIPPSSLPSLPCSCHGEAPRDASTPAAAISGAPSPPVTLLVALPLNDDTISACGIEWDVHDIARFLSYCKLDPSTNCLIWAGGKSRGRGKTDNYGSFWVTSKPGFKGKTIRAHVFYAVSVLGHRPASGIHQLDHTCTNTLCVRHIACVPSNVNRALQWIRVQVSAEDPPDYYDAVIARLEQWVGSNRDRIIPEWEFVPDVYDPRYWPVDGVGC